MTQILSTIPGILAVIIVFGGLIFFHELGHFLVARMFNMGVKTFSIGFGKTLCKKKIGKTTYQVSLLPLGGYVSLVGETPDAELPEGFTEKDSYSLRPAWQRLPVIAAGAFFNIVLAVIICWGIVASQGKVELLPSIGSVTPESPAAIAGVHAGDTITAIDGKAITSWMDIPTCIKEANGKEILFSFLRDGEKKEITITPIKASVEASENPRWIIGITASGDFRTIKLGFGESFLAGLDSAKSMIVLTWRSLGSLVNGSISADNISGPVGITKVIYDESNKGILNTLILAALISVNLGIMNLLPIPVLDGGHIFFILCEIIFRRPLPLAVREKASVVGFALLLGLMFFATYNDVFRPKSLSQEQTTSPLSEEKKETTVESTTSEQTESTEHVVAP